MTEGRSQTSTLACVVEKPALVKGKVVQRRPLLDQKGGYSSRSTLMARTELSTSASVETQDVSAEAKKLQRSMEVRFQRLSCQ